MIDKLFDVCLYSVFKYFTENTFTWNIGLLACRLFFFRVCRHSKETKIASPWKIGEIFFQTAKGVP